MQQKIDISLKELMVAVLRRWGIILVCAALMAGLLGGNRALKPQIGGNVTQDAKLQELQGTLDFYKSTIRAGLRYCDKSYLMKVDPFNTGSASMNINIRVENEFFTATEGNKASEKLGDLVISESTASRILSRYQALIENAPADQVFQGVSEDPEFLGTIREVITVTKSADNLMMITAYSIPGMDGMNLLDRIFAYMESMKPEIVKVAGEHTISILNKARTNAVDTKLADKQIAIRTQIAVYNDRCAILENEIENVYRKGAGKGDISVLSQVLTQAALGFIIGAVLASMYVMVSQLYRLKIQVPEQVQTQLKIRYLGGVRRKSALIGRLGDHLAGELRLADGQEGVKLLALNTLEQLKGQKKILVTGSLSKEALETLTGDLNRVAKDYGVQFDAACDINSNADSILKLGSADAVLLVERLNKSTLKQIAQAQERIQYAQKELLGYGLY